MPLPPDRILRREMTRRDFLWLAGVAGASVTIAPALSGCATSPVTGQTMLSGLSEKDEVAIDRRQASRQFSADFGASQDAALNQYVAEVGTALWTRSHRPQMPYSARAVNANYVNAYTFPGGSMAASRGILVELQNEDELAGLLGHEIGHVNARHASQRAGQAMAAEAAVAILAGALASSSRTSGWAPVAALGGQVGASALLASYSRDNEREADALGMAYMTRAGYNPDGMVGLMGLLQAQSKAKPGMLETMFATHPMSDERYATARLGAERMYAASREARFKRERYMDSTARLRGLKPAIDAEQRGQGLLAKKSIGEAEAQFAQALAAAPDDYPGLVLMARAQLAQKRFQDADRYVERAVIVYPGEGQALALSGVVKLAIRQPELALQRFEAYDRALPGNPTALFFKGVALESMQNRAGAAQQYRAFLKSGARGNPANYATQRLREWGASAR
jgi:predicted Zn-dependent protease